MIHVPPLVPTRSRITPRSSVSVYPVKLPPLSRSVQHVVSRGACAATGAAADEAVAVGAVTSEAGADGVTDAGERTSMLRAAGCAAASRRASNATHAAGTIGRSRDG